MRPRGGGAALISTPPSPISHRTIPPADLHRRVRRRHRRHQRGGCRDVQVRHHARLGEGVDGGAGGWRGARRRARRDGRRSRRVLRNRPVRPRRPAPRAALPDAGCAKALGRLLRGAGHGPHRPVRRIRRHARRHHRGDAAGAARPAVDVPGVRAVRRSRRGTRVRAAPARCARETWRAHARAASTWRRFEQWTLAAWRSCAGWSRPRARYREIPEGAMALLVTLELPRT